MAEGGAHNTTDDDGVGAQPASRKFASLIKSIERSCEYINSSNIDNLDYTRACVRYERLLDHWKEFNDLFYHLMDKSTDELAGKYEAEFARIEDVYIEGLSLIRIHIDGVRPVTEESGRDGQISAANSESGRQAMTVNVKMPLQMHDIKNTWGFFDGSYRKWKGFRDRFVDAVHDNEEIKDSFKFAKLKDSLTESAAKAFGEWELNKDCYHDAWERLNKLYNHKYLICKEHIHELFNLPVLDKEPSANQLRHMTNVTHEQIRQLRSHGIPVDQWDMLICVILHDRLQNEIGRQWELTRSSEMPTAVEMLDFLDKQATALSNFILNEPEIKVSSGRASSKSSVESGKNTRPTSTGAIKKHFPCECCSGDHALYKCDNFLSLNLSARWDFIRKRQLCPNCMKRGHGKENCYSVKCSDVRCLKEPNHNSTLCTFKQVHKAAFPVGITEDWSTKDKKNKKKKGG